MNKRNRFDLPPQALLLAAAVIITVLLVTIGVNQFEQSKELSDVASENILSTTQELRDSDITQYDGLDVRGSDVVNFYKKHLGDYASSESGPFIINITNLNGTYSYSNGSSLSELRDVTSLKYVKPTAVYNCTVSKNANQVILSVSFVIDSRY